jgi:cysteine desulfurase / selenocysteine lyase
MRDFNIDNARMDTPGCSNVLHFNNAGASLMPKSVLEAVSNHLELESQIGGYEAAAMAEEKIASFYTIAARLINAKPSEIAFIENATRAWDMAFYSLKFSLGDEIITAAAEYASNFIAFLQIAKRTGAKIKVIPNDSEGQISLEELKKQINPKTKLIALTHVPSQGGLINPAAEVGKIANEAGVFYLLDATQSVGQMPIDVRAIGCDALCATGRKFLRGPRGTGFLFVSERKLQKLEPPFLDLHAATWTAFNKYHTAEDARRFETWETSYANKIGLAEAIKYALDWSLEATWPRIQELASYLRSQLNSIPGLVLRDLGKEQCGIVTFDFAQMDPSTISFKLRERKVNVSVSLEEYALLDLGARHLKSIVRASLHYYNTKEEVERFCQELLKVIKPAN